MRHTVFPKVAQHWAAVFTQVRICGRTCCGHLPADGQRFSAAVPVVPRRGVLERILGWMDRRNSFPELRARVLSTNSLFRPFLIQRIRLMRM